MNPHHPPHPGQPATGVGQMGGPGALLGPGLGLGAIGQYGRQQLGPDHRQDWAEVSSRLGGAWMPGLYALLA